MSEQSFSSFADLGRQLGIPSAYADSLGGLDQKNRLVIVTFTDPPARDDGKRDPIAYLPPNYKVYGILDGNYRYHASVGETWICDKHTAGATWLVPLVRLSPASVLALRPDLIEELSQAILRNRPLSEEVVAKLRVGNPADSSARKALEDQIEHIQAAFDEATKAKAAIAHELDQAKAALAEARTDADHAKGELTMLRTSPPQTVPIRVTSDSTDDTFLSTPPSGGLQTARRINGDVVESAAFSHPGYDVLYTPDLRRVFLRPSPTGNPCSGGRINLAGISRIDTTPAPRTYRLTWETRAGAFVIHIEQPSPSRDASEA